MKWTNQNLCLDPFPRVLPVSLYPLDKYFNNSLMIINQKHVGAF